MLHLPMVMGPVPSIPAHYSSQYIEVGSVPVLWGCCRQMLAVVEEQADTHTCAHTDLPLTTVTLN